MYVVPKIGPVHEKPLPLNCKLPAQTTSFVGRQKEVRQACDLSTNPDVRHLTLTGPPGTGKTRLALQVASELAGQYRDGIYFVGLAHVGQPELVAPTIAQALGLREAGERSLLTRLHKYLCEKQLLLLLDNFEQVVQAGLVIAELLRSSAHLRVLVTSRMSAPPLWRA